MDHEMTEVYMEFNKVSTKISTIGKMVGDSFKNTDDLVVIIPGNPGVNAFYYEFAKRINEKLKCSVWCIGHAGHNIPTKSLETLPKFEDNKDLYGIKGQVQNKVDFFEKCIPENATIHLVGHSIGSYMALELLNHPSISKRIKDAYFLFPTLEYMADTKNGKVITNYVNPIVWLVLILSGIFDILPSFVQTGLLHVYMMIAGVVKNNCDSIRQLVKPSILKRVFFLADDEMKHVLERNNQSIESNIKKIKILYGKTDGWAPLTYYNGIKKDFPNIDAEVTSFNHAFVLTCSNEIGDIVCDWISSKA